MHVGAFVDSKRKTISIDIAYVGALGCGKVSNLEALAETAFSGATTTGVDPDGRLFFVRGPVGKIRDYEIVVKLFAAHGGPFYSEARRLLFGDGKAKSLAGVVWVIDSRAERNETVAAMLDLLDEELAACGYEEGDLVHVVQYSHRDADDALSVDELEAQFNASGLPSFDAIPSTGEGVIETFRCMMSAVLRSI